MSKKAKALAARYGKRSDVIEILEEILAEKYRVTAFTNPDYPIVTNDEEVQVAKWGLIPFWEKTVEKANEIRKLTYNAKADTVFEKPSFREPIKKHRCLVPSTGFFEWHHNSDGTKTPYFIRLKDEEIFSMAGIFDEWKNPETGELVKTFSIITTEANPLMAEIHNSKKRMPVILSREDEAYWLKPSLSKEEVQQLCLPFDEKQMEAWEIDNDFLKKSPSDKDVIAKKS